VCVLALYSVVSNTTFQFPAPPVSIGRGRVGPVGGSGSRSTPASYFIYTLCVPPPPLYIIYSSSPLYIYIFLLRFYTYIASTFPPSCIYPLYTLAPILILFIHTDRTHPRAIHVVGCLSAHSFKLINLFILLALVNSKNFNFNLPKKGQIVAANDTLPFRTHHVLPSVSAAQNKESISQQSGCVDGSECLPDEVHTQPCLHGWDQVAL
jgi:hypothetical protein